MPKNNSLKKILVIGSGPIVIGQAAEFDYSGSQCLQVLSEEGIQSVIVNSNPATIMTDKELASKVYMEPLTLTFLKKIISKERPNAIIGTMGGQTGLNLTKSLEENGFLDKEGVKILGPDLASIKDAEDRLLFRKKMIEIGEPVPTSEIVTTIEEGIVTANKIGYPIIIRPAYTLGGSGGGMANDEIELREILTRGLALSSINQCLLEKNISGFKEIEYEVIRDSADNTIIVCNMENIDPVGIHTGDSIVVAPSLTLNDKQYQLLRNASIKIVKALNIIGGCNVQLALDPKSNHYYVIEVNPRVSRSSALASKATGYPIAKVATKIAIGYTLDEIINPITKNSYASFEPALDYIVVKIPRWPFDKFPNASRKLCTQMKATGEVMALGRSFEQALSKALRSLEQSNNDLLDHNYSDFKLETLTELIHTPDDQRIFALSEFFNKGGTLEQAHQQTRIDPYFLYKIKGIVSKISSIKSTELNRDYILSLKEIGITNYRISKEKNIKISDVEELLKNYKISPVFKMVDTCAGEFEASTPYFYSSYEDEDEVQLSKKESIVILGSGPIRIGQGIEFDYSSVHAIKCVKDRGYDAVMINNNPETVSTDFSVSSRLYFEPLYLEDILNILKKENPKGIIVQFGGQTAINLAKGLEEAGYTILGTSVKDIDRSEDREHFESMLDKLNIARPNARLAYCYEQAIDAAKIIGYPMMVRPSFVLGGRAMEIIHSNDDLKKYLKHAVDLDHTRPVLLDQYISGKEIEVDALSDGKEVLIPGIMEHIERAGVHSGDSMAVYPPQNLFIEVIEKVIEVTTKIAIELQVKGIINIQFVYKKGELYILEVNPRASRTVPFLSKMTGIPMAQIATDLALGKTLKDLGQKVGLAPTPNFVSIKLPVFSFDKLTSVETALGPEMKSTGEVLGRERDYPMALYKGFMAQGIKVPMAGTILATISDRYKEESLPIIRGFFDLGFKILATPKTKAFLDKYAQIRCELVNHEGNNTNQVLSLLKQGKVDIIINTLSKGKKSNKDAFLMRRFAAERDIPCLTSLDTAEAILKVISHLSFKLYEG